ncbi:hypothetical protein [Ostreibacterium oceani]|uniref:Uncharacterized protein n=1 Tax=Ostreibacterium oceani TaxID=2654998 RepID=A0A6N7EUL3_9GAMM|nr:hypothetical protein [Ostreibacterium oceani]MPV86142.1 hypothetical protein [Ostreibacterium oceani]
MARTWLRDEGNPCTTLISLSKYADKKRLDAFYAVLYLAAFPSLLETVSGDYREPIKEARQTYSLRTFERFLIYFGFVTIEDKPNEKPNEKQFGSDWYITKTDLFDKFIQCRPHNADSGKNKLTVFGMNGSNKLH